MPVLSINNLSGGYGEADILHGISLEINAGEIVVVIGPNGAGKSTAMKAVFGLLRLSGGSVHLAGEEITNMDPAEVVNKGVCYVPQTNNVFPTLTVHENLEMGAYIRKDDFRPRLAEIYEMFPPLAEKKRQAAGELSGGQRQMVAMGKALMLEPTLLMLDEPTAGMSPSETTDSIQLINDIANLRSLTLLFTEHDMKVVFGIADQITVLHHGEILASGSPDEVRTDREVQRVYLGGEQ